MACFLDKRLFYVYCFLIKLIHFPKIFWCICFFVQLILYYTKYKASCMCVFTAFPSNEPEKCDCQQLDHLNWCFFKKLYSVNFFPSMFFLVDREDCKCFVGFFQSLFLHWESTFRLGSWRESLGQSAKQTYLPSTSLCWTVSLRATPMARELTLECVAHQNKRNSLCSFQVKQPDGSLQGSCLYWIASDNGATRWQFMGMQLLWLQHLPPF